MSHYIINSHTTAVARWTN